jgi:hypothetical protein
VKGRLVKNCGYNGASATGCSITAGMVIKNDSFSSQEMQWKGPLGDYLSMV